MPVEGVAHLLELGLSLRHCRIWDVPEGGGGGMMVKGRFWAVQWRSRGGAEGLGGRLCFSALRFNVRFDIRRQMRGNNAVLFCETQRAQDWADSA